MKCIVVNPIKEYLLFIVHCSYYSFPLLRCHWGVYQKQLVEAHQIQDSLVCLLSCHSKLLSKEWSSELDSLSVFLVSGVKFLANSTCPRLQLGFWLYYIFFILWVLIQLLHLLIVDTKSFVFVGSNFMQQIKHQ